MKENPISSRRLKNLLQYEWAIEKRFYIIGILGIFIITFGVFLTIWFNNIVGFIWRSVDYNSIFFGGFIFLSVFGISRSFVDLREKKTAIRYLALPSSLMEKYLVQVFLRLFLPLTIYPIVYWLGANLAVDVYYFIQHSLLERTTLPEICKAEILYLYWIPYAAIDVGYWIVFEAIVSVPILMFMGGIIFGKWGFIAMPAATVTFLLFLSGSYLGLSWLLNASAFGLGGNYSIRVDNPEVFEGIPLFALNLLILFWLVVLLPLVVAYFKLKERQI